MITGGTGSFGNAVLNRFLATDIREIRIFSRDEKKQDDMRHEYQAKYPEVAKFGTEVVDQEENEEATKSQNVVPFSAAKKADAVEVADAETEVVSEDIEKVG